MSAGLERRARSVWALGVAACVLAVLASAVVASALPLGYDFRAYWLAARDVLSGGPMYPALDAQLGRSGEFHYLPLVALPFVILAPLPSGVAALIWLAFEVALALAVGVYLVRPLPWTARPWAAAAYVFFLPLVLEVTLGNLDLLSLALCLAAWHWRHRRWVAPAFLALGVGIKFLPAALIPFYLASGRWRIVARAVLIGVAPIVLSWPWLSGYYVHYVQLFPRYAETDWVRLIVERNEPAPLAGILWSDAFPLVLSASALVASIAAGRASRGRPDRETDLHHLTLAIAPYLAPFGFVWTTFLITSLPLFATTLGRALALPAAARALAVAAIGVSWFLMELVRLHDLWPLIAHLAGVLVLVALALALLPRGAHQTLGRSTPARHAASSVSG